MRKEDPSQAKKSQIVARTSRKWRIMAVDDEHDITLLFKAGLEGRGFQVEAYNDPKTALEHFKPGVYDLLLLDVRMPGMNGFELYQEIKKRDERIRVCFLTAFEEYKQEFVSTFPALDEVKCFLKKPMAVDELVKRITAVLEPG